MLFIKKHKIKLIIAVILLTAYYFSLPKQLFNKPTSTVIESAEGELLGAKIADDGQWRFPQNDNVSEKFKQCIVEFEDAYFYKHPGFNPVSIVKALSENFKSKKVKRVADEGNPGVFMGFVIGPDGYSYGRFRATNSTWISAAARYLDLGTEHYDDPASGAYSGIVFDDHFLPFVNTDNLAVGEIFSNW